MNEPQILLTFKPTISKIWNEIRENDPSPRRIHELLDALMGLSIRINQSCAHPAQNPANAHEHALFERSVRMIEQLTDMCFIAMYQIDAISLQGFMQKHLGDVIDSERQKQVYR